MIMKRKTITAIAATLLSASLFASCSISYQATFKDYWFSNPNTTPTEVLEELTYKISYEKGESAETNGYALSYSNGTYTTRLTLNDEGQYVYETKLTVDVSYMYGALDPMTKTDTVETRMVFSKNAKLTPISSYKKIVCYSPLGNATSLETCYNYVDYTVETTYAADLTGGTSKVTNNKTSTPAEYTFELESDYTCLDNEQLLFALRGLEQTSASTFYVYSPFAQKVQKVKATFGTKVEGESFSYQKPNGTDVEDVGINYYPVTLVLNEKNPGAPQTVWIAEMSNAQSNTHRNVILKLSTPLPYSLGSLTYTLQSATFA